MFGMILTISLLTIVLLPVRVLGAPGDLDISFNPLDGYVTYDVGTAGSTDEMIFDLVIQPDGKIVAVGMYDDGSDQDVLVLRYKTDGTLDETFGNGGVVVYDHTGLNTRDAAMGAAVQPDGRIVGTGYSNIFGHEDVLVFRLNRDGSPDGSFGQNGAVTVDLSITNPNDFGGDVALIPDGRIVVAGATTDGPNPWEGDVDGVILMLDTDGELDPNFNWPTSPGKIIYDPGASNDAALFSVEAMPDGRILAGGYQEDAGIEKVLILRYDNEGNPDTSLAGDGSLLANPGGDVQPGGVAIQPDGKIVVTGNFYAGSGNGRDLFVLRTSSSGTLDNTFDSDGWATWSYGSDDVKARDLAIQTDGKIVAVGDVDDGPASGALVWRFDENGNLDSSFSSDGVAWFGSHTYDNFTALGLQPDGKIVVGGNFRGAADGDALVARYVSETFTEVRLVTPDRGEEIPAGKKYAIGWGAPTGAETFKLRYSVNNGKNWKTAAGNIMGSQHVWKAQKFTKNKKKCLFKVIGYDPQGDKVGSDRSDGKFTIEVVKVTAPAGGETWDYNGTGDNIRVIRWRTSGTKKRVAKARIYLSKNGGRTWKLIGKDPDNSGRFEWTLPQFPDDKTRCKIKVVLKSADGKTLGTDVSEGTFTILSP
jgi:uncharacterized delta-60 repeat protein